MFCEGFDFGGFFPDLKATAEKSRQPETAADALNKTFIFECVKMAWSFFQNTWTDVLNVLLFLLYSNDLIC